VRIGFRHRRRGNIDRLLLPKRAQIARMLAGAALSPREWPPHALGLEAALGRINGAAPRILAPVIRGPAPVIDAASPPPLSFPHPTALAIDHARRGAHAILVATDGPFLGGAFAELAAIRAGLDEALGPARPLLVAMDFVIHPIQLDRVEDAGADAVVLIARLVSPEALIALVAEARSRGIEPLVEIANGEDLAAAEAADARVLGVSARDLNTGRSDAERGKALLEAIDPRLVAIDLGGVGSDRADAVLDVGGVIGLSAA
jgi:indole-3-glycerol phosphate synthase